MRLEVGWFMHGLTGHWPRCPGWYCVRQRPRVMTGQAERTCGTGAQSIERIGGLASQKYRFRKTSGWAII